MLPNQLLIFILGRGDDSIASKNGTRTEIPSKSKSKTGQTVLFVLLGIGGAAAIGFFLFKYWQKKKREEQHARLLKLFEEDDELEVELGLRD
jgi:flagellar basal body-associated protein FliL